MAVVAPETLPSLARAPRSMYYDRAYYRSFPHPPVYYDYVSDYSDERAGARGYYYQPPGRQRYYDFGDYSGERMGRFPPYYRQWPNGRLR